MDENPDDLQPKDPNHNYRSGYQGFIRLPTSLERRIASDAGEMAGGARASRLAQQPREQAMSSAAASASANAVTFARIERSLARSEAITEEETTEEAEIEKWKRSNDAARLRADLNAAQRQSPEIEGRALEIAGVRERIVSRMQTESGERGMGVMPSAMPIEMLDAQRDSDKEEMEADAVWPAKIKKEGKENVPAPEERKAERQGRSKKHAFGLDGADERSPSPARTPLPPSRAASMSTQVGPDSEATTSAATTSAWRAGLSPVSTPGEVLRALYDRNDMSNGERYLKKVIQDREETTKRLLDHSKEVAGTDRGGLELLGVVSRTLDASALRKSRREECEDLLREIAPRGGVHGEDRREKAREMAESMIEDYQKETRALEERLVELSRESQLASLENVRVRPRDLLDHMNWAGREEENEEMEKHRASMRESNLREMERRFGFDLAKQLNDRLKRNIAAAGQIPDEFYHPAQAVRNRFLPDTFPVDGEDYFRPPCLSQPTRATEQAAGSGRGRPSSGAILDPSLMCQRYLPQSASGTASATTSTLGGVGPEISLTGGASEYWPHPNSGAICVPASTLEGLGPAQPLTGRSSTYLPHPASGTTSATPSTLRGVGPALSLSGPSHGRPPTSARAMQDILDGVQRGEIEGLLNFNNEETNDNPLPSYALLSALPDANRLLSSSLLRQQANDRDGAERFSLEREVLASIAAMAGSSINEAQDNEDAQAERSPVADRPEFSAAMDGARTMAQVLGEDYAKEMRERTIREREERILKRARQISAQHAPLPAVFNRVEVTRVASHGGDGTDTAGSEGISLENLRPLKFSEFGRQRLDDLRDDEKQAESRSGALPDLSNAPRNRYSEDRTKPQPWLKADRPRPGPPSGLHGAFLAEYRRASSAARTSQEKTNEEGKGDGKVKGKEKPNLSIATTRTITDMELQIERAKAFNEGNMAAFKDMETARKKGFQEGAKSVMGQQSSGGGPEEGVRSRAGQKSSYLHTILGTFKSEIPGPQKEAEEGKAEDDPRIIRALAKDGESVADGGKTKEEEEENSDLYPHGFWGLVQFDSHAGFVGPLPRDFPWQSETCNAELFRLGWPNTLSSLKASLEGAVKKEFQAMKAEPSSEASVSKSRSAGEAGRKWLEEHRISGFTLLWNWRREHIFAGEGMMSSRTPCLRTRVTERNLQGVLWEMSEESGRHVLLVHTAKREKEVDVGEEVGKEKKFVE